MSEKDSIQKRIENRNLGFWIFLGIMMSWPIFYPNPYYLNVMIFTGINTLVATGLNLLFGYAGQISMGHATFLGIGAYCSAFFTVKLGWNPWLGFLIGVLITSLFSFLIGLPSLKLRGYYLAMATLAFGIIMETFFVELKSITGGPDGIGGIPALSLFGFKFHTDLRYYYLVWVIVACLTLLVINLVNSRAGRGMRALHESELAASVLGINTFRYKLAIFIFSAIYASIGGSLFAHYITHITPESFSIMHSILIVVMVIIGGMGKIWGPLLGAGIMTILPETLRAFEVYHEIAYGLILVLIMIYFTDGVAGALNFVFKKIPFFNKKLIS
ncbi:MAG: branched-chain amino acid ABC transporter permease [Thermodesulfobacteriota bacterium]